MQETTYKCRISQLYRIVIGRKAGQLKFNSSPRPQIPEVLRIIGLYGALFWGGYTLATPRLVSTSPQLTELTFQLGIGKWLIATPQFSAYPSAATRLPVLGPLGFPGIERTFHLAPSAVLVDSPLPIYRRALKRAGIIVHAIDTSTPQKLLSESHHLIRLFSDAPDRDLRRLALVEKCFDSLQNRLSGQTVMAFVWTDPPILFGPRSFFGALLEQMGAVNASASIRNPYPAVATDWILAHPPRLAIWVTDYPEASRDFEQKAREWWPGKTVKTQVLSEAKFARASLSPILFGDEIAIPSPTNDDCIIAKAQITEAEQGKGR